MANEATRFDAQFGIVRHPSSQGAILAKLGNNPLVPDELWEHDDLVFQSVDNASELTDAQVDYQAILDLEGTGLGDLLEEHWRLLTDAKAATEQ